MAKKIARSLSCARYDWLCMEKAISTFISKCWNRVVGQRPNNSNDSEQPKNSAEFLAEWKDSLEYVEKFKSAIAYDLACDRMDEKVRQKEDEEWQRRERQQRAEQIMERGKSYTPMSVPCPEKDGPDLEPD